MYLDNAITHDANPQGRADTKARISAMELFFLEHSLSRSGRRPDRDNISALSEMPMPKGIGQIRSFLGRLSYYRTFLSKFAKHLQPLAALLKKGIAFEFASTMSRVVRYILQEPSQPSVLAFLDWDAAQNQSRPLLLYSESCQDGFGLFLNNNNQVVPYDRSHSSIALPWLWAKLVSHGPRD